MRNVTLATSIALVLTSPAARADFVVAGAPPVAAAPHSPIGHRQPTDVPSRAPPAFPIALGFGHQVPLRFAVQQIVPKVVKVSYGPGADPGATVDWKGGQPWNRALRDAVQPLGLRLVTTAAAVEIRK